MLEGTVGGVETFITWGTEVRSRSGRVGTPIVKRAQIALAGICMLQMSVVTKVLLRRWVALLIHPFMHRRRCMSCLHRVYAWMETLSDCDCVPIPSDIKIELALAILLLAVSEGNIRWPISSLLSATDATPTSGGAVAGVVSSELAHVLYGAAEYRCEYTRLDWNSELEPSKMRPLRRNSESS